MSCWASMEQSSSLKCMLYVARYCKPETLIIIATLSDICPNYLPIITVRDRWRDLSEIGTAFHCGDVIIMGKATATVTSSEKEELYVKVCVGGGVIERAAAF